MSEILTQKIVPLLPVFTILFLGFLLRAYNFYTYPFGFDQVQILENAEAIAGGDLRLIGPMTGPAQMFTGPLIYYLCALWYLVIGSPYAIVATSLTIYVITALSIAFLTTRYLTLSSGLLFLSLYVFSPYIISLDRVPWNPNFIFLASALCLFPLLKSVRLKVWGLHEGILLFLGCFLSYQAHFSGFILPVLVIILWLLFVRKGIVWLLFGLGGFILSLLPTIIFDITHGYLNTKGLLAFLMKNQQIQEIGYGELLKNNLKVTVENLGKMVFSFNGQHLIYFTGYLIFFLVILKSWCFTTTKILFVWLLGTVLALSVYKSGSPEYYFIIQFPALLFILFETLIRSKISQYTTTVIIVFSLFSISSTYWAYHESGNLNLGDQIKTVRYLQAKNQKSGVSEIIFDTQTVHQVGIKYLTRSFSYTHSGTPYHIIYPYKPPMIGDKIFGQVAVWSDPRPQKANYLELPFAIISHSPEIRLLGNFYEQSIYESSYLFSLFLDDVETGKVAVVERSVSEQHFDLLANHLNACIQPNKCEYAADEWVKILGTGKEMYLYRNKSTILAFYPNTSLTQEQTRSSLNVKVVKNYTGF